MRQKTRDELIHLAERLSDEYHIEKVIGSNEFLEIALDVVEEEGIPLSAELLKKYEGELKRLCSSFMKESKTFIKDINEVYTVDNLVEKKLKMTIHYYDDGTYEVVKHNSQKEVEAKIPHWTWFVQGEDGILYIKGQFKGQLAGCGGYFTNSAGYKTSEYKYAKHFLDASKSGLTDLTEDDLEVFQKIVDGLI